MTTPTQYALGIDPAPAVTPEKQLFTNSAMQKAQTCFRAYDYAYNMRMRLIRDSDALSEGDAFHKALEHYDFAPGTHDEKKAAGMQIIARKYATVPKWCQTDEDWHDWQCQGAKMAALFSVHCDYWQHDKLEIVATEMVFQIPLRNPETGKPSQVFDRAGKIDRIVRLHDGRLAIQEYKTTSDDITPESEYWKRLRIDSQISGYIIAAREMGYPVETVLYDVTRKPKRTPYKATPLETRKYTKDGVLYKNQHESDESHQDYAQRIYEAVTGTDEKTGEPNITKYFRREEIARIQSDLDEHQHDVWSMQKMIRAAQLTGRFPRNTSACKNWYGRCPYFDICTLGVEVDPMNPPDGFEILDTPHPELT